MMKKSILIFSTCLLLIDSIRCQQVTIERIQESTLKINQWNYLKIAAEEKVCSSLIIRTNARVEKYQDCTWKVMPNQFKVTPGLALDICEIVDSDTILVQKRWFRIEKLNPLEIRFNNFARDTITIEKAKTLKSMIGFEAYGQYNCFKTTPKHFKCMILRGRETQMIVENEGGSFNSELLESISTLKSGDQLIFFDINFGKLIKRYKPSKMTKLVVK